MSSALTLTHAGEGDICNMSHFHCFASFEQKVMIVYFCTWKVTIAPSTVCKSSADFWRNKGGIELAFRFTDLAAVNCPWLLNQSSIKVLKGNLVRESNLSLWFNWIQNTH